jgi:uncharacterized protein YuzE
MKHKTTSSHDIQIDNEDVAYIKLPYASDRKVSRTVDLREIVADYKGCTVMLDFSEDGTLMGIEIIA